jgi:hypothetical protein
MFMKGSFFVDMTAYSPVNILCPSSGLKSKDAGSSRACRSLPSRAGSKVK